MSGGDGAPRRRPVQREHELSKAVRVFVRDALDIIPTNYQFFAFDSAQKATDNQRARMVARGIVVGCPDTLLCAYGFQPFWAELKYGKNKPSGDQNRLIEKLVHIGHHVCVIRSVAEYAGALNRLKFPLRQNWLLIAADLDLKVDARITKAEQRIATPGRAPKAAPRYTASKRMARKMYAK
jgi:hypothetical protein